MGLIETPPYIHAVQPLLARRLLRERLGEQVAEQQDLDPALAEHLRERPVFQLRPLDPHDLVEQQLVDVGGSEPGQLEVRLVEQDAAKPADLRADIEPLHARSLPGRRGRIARNTGYCLLTALAARTIHKCTKTPRSGGRHGSIYHRCLS